MATGGQDSKIPRGGGGVGVGTRVGGEHGGMTDRDRQHLAGRINIRREIDKDDGRTTDNQAPGSGKAKPGRKITTEWS